MKIFTNRAVLERMNFPAGHILVDELEQRIVGTSRQFLDTVSVRSEIMRRACAFKEFQKLDLDENSMAFFQNATLLVKFFQEISVEKVSLDQLSKYDSYKKYSDHVGILKQILQRYTDILDENNKEDMITMSTRMEVTEKNQAWIKEQEEIEVFYDGIMSRFDLSILEIAALYTKVSVILKTDDWYNKSIVRLQGFGDLHPNAVYKLDFNSMKMEKVQDTSSDIAAKVNSVNMSSMYTPYVNTIKNQLLSAGEVTDDIAVVYTSEEDRRMLSLYSNGEFSFASGTPGNDTLLYKKMNIVREVMSQKGDKPLFKGMDKSAEKQALKRMVDSSAISIDWLQELVKIWEQDAEARDVFDFIEAIMGENPTIHDFVADILNDIQKHKDIIKAMQFSQIWDMVLYEMSFRTIEDDFVDGQIRVYDFMKTRGVSFKNLIVIGFDKGKVPVPAKKDMFIDSSLRIEVGMPVHNDRAELQKHYWNSLFTKASSVFICHKESDKATGSPFILELGLPMGKKMKDSDMTAMMFDKTDLSFDGYTKEIKAEVEVDRVLSATKLKEWNNCKRKYFFKYVDKIKEPSIMGHFKEERETGNIIHKAMDEILNKNIVLDTEEKLAADIIDYIKSKVQKSLVSDFSMELWTMRVKKFVKTEWPRINGDITSIVDTEAKLEGVIEGVRVMGILDRIDVKADGSNVIVDYKTGKTPALRSTGQGESDFQPEMFKALLAQNDGKNISFAYRNLNTNETEFVNTSDKRQEAFIDSIVSFRDDKGEYEMTDDRQKCRFCSFNKICGRN